MGVGGEGGGELAKVIFFKKKESKSTKKNFCPFYWRGGEGGG